MKLEWTSHLNLQQNSLRNGTGNFFGLNGEFPAKNREISRPNR
jgi:hypothetical protein